MELVKRFESTYEELKLSSYEQITGVTVFWVYLWGIETFLRRAHGYNGNMRFESTYEELKLLWIRSRSFRSSVLSLPMRNWNVFRLFLYCRLRKRFESTYEELKHRPFIAPTTFLCSFESTYEELKLVHHMAYNVKYFLFWVYLWGIETLKKFCISNIIQSFWVYLWGIETWKKMIIWKL